MPRFEPQNPDYAGALERQIYSMPIARFLGLRFIRVEPGAVELEMPFREELTFTPGTLMAGAIGAFIDFSGGCAVGTLLPVGWATSTLDYTTKVLAPGRGERFLGRGNVLSWGKTISVSEAKVFAISNGQETLIAAGMVTMRNFQIKPDTGSAGKEPCVPI